MTDAAVCFCQTKAIHENGVGHKMLSKKFNVRCKNCFTSKFYYSNRGKQITRSKALSKVTK